MKPLRDDFPAHRKGDLWAAQQLGVDGEPIVSLKYGSGGNSTEMKVEDLLSLRDASDRLV